MAPRRSGQAPSAQGPEGHGPGLADADTGCYQYRSRRSDRYGLIVRTHPGRGAVSSGGVMGQGG